jgi:hypothetical protein
MLTTQLQQCPKHHLETDENGICEDGDSEEKVEARVRNEGLEKVKAWEQSAQSERRRGHVDFEPGSST